MGLTLDNFGTGPSALEYFQRFRFDRMKIHQSLVRTAGGSAEGGSVLSGIVALAHGMGVQIVAEGIEEPEELERLRSEGCNQGQGFLFSKPMSVDSIFEHLRASQTYPGFGTEAEEPSLETGEAPELPAGDPLYIEELEEPPDLELEEPTVLEPRGLPDFPEFEEETGGLLDEDSDPAPRPAAEARKEEGTAEKIHKLSSFAVQPNAARKARRRRLGGVLSLAALGGPLLLSLFSDRTAVAGIDARPGDGGASGDNHRERRSPPRLP